MGTISANQPEKRASSPRGLDGWSDLRGELFDELKEAGGRGAGPNRVARSAAAGVMPELPFMLTGGGPYRARGGGKHTPTPVLNNSGVLRNQHYIS